MKIPVEQDYKQLRQPAYPATGEQLDAIFKLAKALQAVGVQLPEETIAWIEVCQSVKDKYPKTEN